MATQTKKKGVQTDTYNINITNSGYALIRVPSHPLAQPTTGQVLQHRFVLYNELGPELQECAYCSTQVTWTPTPGYKRLFVDHVDGKRHNNQIENLRPACQSCNIKKAKRGNQLPLHSDTNFGFAN